MHPNVIPQHLTTIIWCAHQHIKVKNASIKMLISFSVKTGVFIKKKEDYRKVKMLLNSDLHQVLLSPSD